MLKDTVNCIILDFNMFFQCITSLRVLYWNEPYNALESKQPEHALKQQLQHNIMYYEDFLLLFILMNFYPNTDSCTFGKSFTIKVS